MGIRSSILAWNTRTEEPGGLQSVGLQRVGHDQATERTQHTHTVIFRHNCQDRADRCWPVVEGDGRGDCKWAALRQFGE